MKAHNRARLGMFTLSKEVSCREAYETREHMRQSEIKLAKERPEFYMCQNVP